MIEFYPQIKAVHIGCALASVALFALRGGGLLAGLRWPRSLPVRALSWSIDTALLTAALMLLSILPGAVFGNHWLTAKLALLLAYVGLGHRALAAGTLRRQRLAWLLPALACFAAIYLIARAHHPLGPWLLL
jgi:uncharacterized membrane protein SirB2